MEYHYSWFPVFLAVVWVCTLVAMTCNIIIFANFCNLFDLVLDKLPKVFILYDFFLDIAKVSHHRHFTL